MGTSLAPTQNGAESALILGDLSKLSANERLEYYRQVCASTGLNIWTRPFDYIMLNGKLTLYCRKDATDQLRKIHHVSITVTSRERIDDVYVVTARASLPDGRADESIGAVTIGALKGDGLANALMKAETKAKRRATLSICGLGWLDETELSTIPDAQAVQVDSRTGEIMQPPRRLANPPAHRVLTPDPAAARAKLWKTFDAVVREAKALGIKVHDAELLQADEDASEEEVKAMGKALREAIAAKHESLDEDTGSFVEVGENVELFPNGVPA